MALYDQPNMTTGLDGVLTDVAREVPEFIYGLLLFVFGFVFLYGTSSQRRRTGYSDNSLWAMLASMSTLLVALMLSLIEGLINAYVLGVVLAIVVFAGLWYFLSRGRGEV